MVPAGPIRLEVQDGQYAIWDGVSDLDPPDPGGSGGLVGTAPGLAIVITGTQFGNIALNVQVDDSAPRLDTRPWDEVTEVSLTTGAGSLSILSGGDGPAELDSANRGDRFMVGLRPDGPVAYPFRYTIYPDGSRHVAEIGIWSWPLPPAEPFELSVEWPAIGLERATITLDGAAIMAELGASG